MRPGPTGKAARATASDGRCTRRSSRPIRMTPSLGFSAAESNSITVSADRARNLGTFDPFRREMHLGLGCAIENLAIAAGHFGFKSEISLVQGKLVLSPSNDPIVVAQIALSPGTAQASSYFAMIPRRHTNRGPYRTDPIAAEKLRMLADLVSGPSATGCLLSGGGRSQRVWPHDRDGDEIDRG